MILRLAPRPARLLLFLELDVDDILGLGASVPGGAAVGGGAPGAEAARAGARPTRAAGLTGAGSRVQVLGHGLAGALELVDRLVQRRGILALLDLVDLGDGGVDGGAVGLAELVLVLLEQL